MKTPLRVGIIGMGGFAGAHHRALVALEQAGHARLVCTCDPVPGMFLKEKQEWALDSRGVRIHCDYVSMIEAHKKELDVLVIPTPVHLHARMHRAGVERGIAVYLEKPPTLDPDELEEMIRTERETKLSTLVGFNFMREPTRLALKQRLVSGEFGKLKHASLIAQWARPRSYFQRNSWAGRLMVAGKLVLDSCMGNAMAHLVHSMLFWAGESTLWSRAQLATVQAELYRANAIEGADTVFAQAVTDAGVTLRFALTHAGEKERDHRETLVCEKATITYVAGVHSGIQWRDGRTESFNLTPSDVLVENHLAYYDYIRGLTPQPTTSLADTRSFVALNALAYVSGHKINKLSAAQKNIELDGVSKSMLAIPGIGKLLEQFSQHGIWPSEVLGLGPSNAEPVHRADINKLRPTIQAMTESGG